MHSFESVILGPSIIWTCRECSKAQMSETGYIPVGQLCDECFRKCLREIEDELTSRDIDAQ